MNLVTWVCHMNDVCIKMNDKDGSMIQISIVYLIFLCFHYWTVNNDYELELYIYTSTTPRTPEISLKFEGTPTRPPCASPRTRVSPH